VDSGQVATFRDEDFNGFVRRLRRTLPYYLFTVDGTARAAKLERFLFWSNYKGSTDLFTRYVYPPLVWLAVRPLARWRVHPKLGHAAQHHPGAGRHSMLGERILHHRFIMAYGMSVLDRSTASSPASPSPTA